MVAHTMNEGKKNQPKLLISVSFFPSSMLMAMKEKLHNICDHKVYKLTLAISWVPNPPW